MRAFVVVLTIVSVIALSISFEQLQGEFIRFRDKHDAAGMARLIETLKGMKEKDYKELTLLADALVEYALWGAPDSEKRELYEEARRYAEEAIKLNPNYAYAYFVRGAAIGRLAQYVGIIKSLFMVGDFDYSMKKAIELDPKCYRAMVAMGMRYRDLPWPFRNFGEAERYFKMALEVQPAYLNTYLELGILYEMWGKKEKAKEMFEKVLELPTMKGFTADGLEAKRKAKEHLEKLR